MTITFCGHSQINDQNKLSNWLDMILPALIEGGATTFYLGGYGDFDRLAAAAVKRQKRWTLPEAEEKLSSNIQGRQRNNNCKAASLQKISFAVMLLADTKSGGNDYD